MRIQHNIAALNSYRNLTTNNNSLSKNLEKLSSGYRINRAGDDAAGLAISEKMRAQITGLETAQKNANDGISLVQTAEGALTEVHSMLNRMVELANQSANGTYADEVDRENLQAEIDSLKDEINRISKATNFNGLNLLDGSMGTTTTPADDIATGFKDAAVAGITHIADGATAEQPVKGEFSLDLTSLEMRNDGVKPTLGGTGLNGNSTLADATDDTKKTTITINLSNATVSAVDGATTTGGTLSLKIGDTVLTGKVPAAGIPTAGQDWTGVFSDTEVTVNGVAFDVAVADNGTMTLTAKTAADDSAALAAAPAYELTVSGASDAPVKASITLGTGATAVELGSVDIKSGDSMTGAEWAEKFMEDLKDNHDGVVEIDGTKFNVTNNNGKLSFKMVEDPTQEFETDLSVTLEVKDGAGTVLAKAGGNGADNNADTIVNDNDAGVFINQGNGIGVHIDTKAVPSNGRVLAQGELDLKTLDIKDGTALKIGDETYIFALGAESKFKDATNVIDLTKYEKMDEAGAYADASRLLSKVAAGNKMFDVSTNNTTATNKVLLTERKDSGIDYSKNNLEGTSKTDLKDGSVTSANWKDLIQVGKANPDAKPAVTTGGLVLQIGDTSDDFNKMTVSIGSMSAEALGIDGVDISTQDGAAAAVDQIKAAINKVSSQRGDLGAIQNRLEHTINNLSVTAENITAAESRIRDVDMAKEMMAYTKNNILVQASQAMLAQANQVPQGVLQLLQ